MTMIERRWFAMINFMDLIKGQEYTITELLALECFEDIRRKTLYSRLSKTDYILARHIKKITSVRHGSVWPQFERSDHKISSWYLRKPWSNIGDKRL